MTENGNRIIYDATTGRIEHQTLDSRGTAPHAEITELIYLDLPYGYIDYRKSYIESIDLETGLPIVKDFELTDEQKRIKELEEDVELLKADEENGGIL